MNYDIIRPCPKCPFRKDIKGYLTPARAAEIAHGITRLQQTFACHETTVPCEDGSDMAETADSQHCAGAMIFLEKLQEPNQMMRIAERLGMYDPRKLVMDSPVFDSAREFIKAQR